MLYNNQNFDSLIILITIDSLLFSFIAIIEEKKVINILINLYLLFFFLKMLIFFKKERERAIQHVY